MQSTIKLPKLAFLLMTIQGIYYIMTGIWPLLHMESFLAVTGPKEDIWLVRTFGVLTMAAGIGFLVSGIHKIISWPILATAMSAALGLIIMDTYYVLADIIWPTYLLDAVAQGCMLLCWMLLVRGSFQRN